MSDVKEKLEESIEKLRINAKRETNTLLSEEDIKCLINVLKQEDFELKPVLSILENIFIKLQKEEKYLILEESIIDLLKYYKLLDHNDLLNIRHKIFFNNNKLTKKQFFNINECSEIKTKLTNIYNKI